MALEDKIDALTAALNRNSDLLEGLTAKAAAGAKAAATAAASTPAAAESDKTEEAPRGRGRPPKAAAEPEKPKKVKAPTPEDMAAKTKEFLDVEDEDEYSARRDLVKKIIAKHGVSKMSEIEEDKRQAALDALVAHKAGEATGYEDEEEDLA